MNIADDKCFVPLPGFCAELESGIGTDDWELHLSKYLDISRDEYTVLSVRDDLNMEFITVCRDSDGDLRMHRDDNRHVFDCGAKVQFEWTLEGIQAVHRQKAEEPIEPDCDKQLHSGTIKAGNLDYIVKDGLIVDCVLSKRRYIPAAQYHNVSVCVDEDGCITQIAEGNPLRTGKTKNNDVDW